MKLASRTSLFSAAVVSLLALVLAGLAVLQYRWSGQVSEAEHVRMRAGLETSIRHFREDFRRELSHLCAAFQPDRDALRNPGWDWVATRHQDWLRAAPRPELLAQVYVSEPPAESGQKLLWSRPDENVLEPVEWPSSLENLRVHLRASLQANLQATPRADPRADLRAAVTGPARRPGPPSRPEVRFGGCGLLSAGPALIIPLLRPRDAGLPAGRLARRAGLRRPRGSLVLLLSMEVLQATVFPELVERHFLVSPENAYQVAIFEGPGLGKVVYQPDPDLSPDVFAKPDRRVPLVGFIREEFGRAGPRRGLPPARPPEPLASQDLDQRLLFNRGRFRPRGARAFWGAVYSPPNDAQRWELAVRHPGGSLEAAVAGVRRRNLTLSFGVLLLLAASMAIIIVSTQRAQRLAKLQMDFVAGISHELRTPLAVIGSAAANLADGVVKSPEQVREYGSLIRSEGRRLTGMVEQTLQFSASQASGHHYRLRRTPPADVLDEALRQAQSMIQEADFEIDRRIDDHLPEVKVDPAALSQCIQNLLSNAIKYAGPVRWAGLRAETGRAANGSPEVRISVEDKGAGIDASELSRIFDPFFRGTSATSRRIHGTGLGLSLVRETLKAMGGEISVKSSPGQGSTFTIHLPVAAESSSLEPAPATEV